MHLCFDCSCDVFLQRAAVAGTDLAAPSSAAVRITPRAAWTMGSVCALLDTREPTVKIVSLSYAHFYKIFSLLS